MSYQVLARKWRPQNFSQIVGQEHVSRSLMHALQNDRLHHAYLFTGTRGVGKTTIARILAKSINCESPVEGSPCQQCSVCEAFDQGRFIDLVEIDAASRTKVEDTRDLLDNVQYAPSHGRFKVYLIDEVHMLSGHSFNALLKTLEEPPLHVKFLLATTDPQKIPVTVLSRCLQFNLKRLMPAQIVKQMEYILSQEHIAFEEQAIVQLARAADGSMRDGLSLLDQAIAFGNGQVNNHDVEGMLGTVSNASLEGVMSALAEQDIPQCLQQSAAAAELSVDFNELLQQLIRLLHAIALYQQVPGINYSEFDATILASFSSKLSAEDVQLFYQIAIKGRQDLALAPDPRSGFEMVLLRMLVFKPGRLENKPTPYAVKSGIEAANNQPQQEPAIAAERSKNNAESAAAASTELNDWANIIDQLNLRGLSLQLACNCLLDSVDAHSCALTIDPDHENLISPKTQQKLERALQDYFGRPLKLRITKKKTDNDTPAIKQQKVQDDRQQAAVDAINADKNIQILKDQMGARILPGSIKPVED